MTNPDKSVIPVLVRLYRVLGRRHLVSLFHPELRSYIAALHSHRIT